MQYRHTRRALKLAAMLLAGAVGAAVPAVAEDGLAGPYLAARSADHDGDFVNAARYLSQVLARDPKNPALLENAILSYVALAKFESALPIARRLDALEPGRAGARLALMAERLKRESYGEVLSALADNGGVGKLVDGLLTAWANLGEGKMSEAIASFDSMTETPGMGAFGMFHKALALAAVGDFEGADAIFSSEAGKGLNLTRRGAIAHAQILSQLERNSDAIGVLEATFGTTSDAVITALRQRLQAGETLPYDVARNAAEGAAEVFFSVAGALNGDADDSFTLLYSRIAEYLRPEHTDAILLSAQLLDHQNQFDLAVESFNRIPREDPAFVLAEQGRAEALFADEQKEAATEAMRQLARLVPNDLTIHVALGDMLRRQERYGEAAAAYENAIALIDVPEERHWPVYYSRAVAYERTGEWDKAEADFRTSLKLSPDQPQVLNYLGYSYLEKNSNLDEALKMIETAVAAAPDSGYIVDSLGWALYRLGRYDEAVQQMERAVELMPLDAVVTDHLADVYWAVGRKREADFQWRRALSFITDDTDDVDPDRIRRKLDVGLDAVLAEEGAPPRGAMTANGN